jgi:DNA invertase Pin-like site-specific DNA recombinase
VDRQIADCRDLAERKGWTVVELYEDNDLSAYSGKRRPAYERMLADIKAGQLDAVLAWHLDRLHRQPKELETFIEVCGAASLALATVTGEVDLSTSDGLFTARIQGAVARKSSDDMSRRIRRKHEELAHAGKIAGGGSRPYGYKDDRKRIEPAEARVIREATTRVLAGESLRSVCADFDARRIPTATGGTWKIQTLRRILLSARISGQREYHGEIVAPGEWKAIITPAETLRLRAMFNDPSRRQSRTPRRYLLTGLVRCGLCGVPLIARPRADDRRCYVCATGPGYAGCGKIRVVADQLEDLITEAAIRSLDNPELAETLAHPEHATDDDAALLAETAADEALLQELAHAYAQRAFTLPEWLTARTEIEARITAAKKRLSFHDGRSALDGYVGNAKALRAKWGSLPIDRRRAVIAALIDRVVIGPGRRGLNRFDPARATPVWKN